jgi:hypothetical protein
MAAENRKVELTRKLSNALVGAPFEDNRLNWQAQLWHAYDNRVQIEGCLSFVHTPLQRINRMSGIS